MKKEIAVFAAGCFWGVEAEFRNVEGVLSTRVGYTGGHSTNPTYKEVCSHTTGHAEAIEITFDAGKVSYKKLLDAFWNLHDPTQLNRQGPDIGDSYRSAIFYRNDTQKKEAEASRAALQKSAKYRGKKIVTEIVPATNFYKAEEYHQRYLEKHGRATCRI
jgi:peptide-methionine (S)-S-oxide reductase